MMDIDEEPKRNEVGAGAVNLWGPPPPRSWFEEAAPFAGTKVTEAPAGDPLTLEKYLFAKVPKAEAVKRRA